MDTKRQIAETGDGATKKLKSGFSKEEIKSFFNEKIWKNEFREEMRDKVENSKPYHWGSIDNLFDDKLLRKVREEILSQIAFTKKETDIYKVFQSGDLANMSGLNWDDLSKLPSLFKIRAGIYSEEFRNMISAVTGCGKLSGEKTDMSINTYSKGCHLLTHDDVIGSRRVSFILYLPDPDKSWKSHYGGGLRLFPAVVPNVPETQFSAKFVPQFNQIAFFTVQPGHSFHDVEEVRVDRQRVSIQGWFHIPQPGEDGYIEGEQEETEAKSTLQQLQTKELQEYDFPKPIREDLDSFELSNLEEKSEDFSEQELTYLRTYINTAYLQPSNISTLCESFLDESVIELKDFLNEEFSAKLREVIRQADLNEVPQTPSEIKFPWKCAVPPHKQRYMYLDGREDIEITKDGITKVTRVTSLEPSNFSLVKRCAEDKIDKILCDLAIFLKSASFHKWLKYITNLVISSQQILVRRFRPGQDFILATTTGKNLARNETELDALLEATLGLTPTAVSPKNWESGEFGGYELCMGIKDSEDSDYEEDDPAIYKASDPNDDSVLYTAQCKWNCLSIMLRDPSVLKFVKYVSINAKGSRWDISCQWNIKSMDDEYDDESDNDQMTK